LGLAGAVDQAMGAGAMASGADALYSAQGNLTDRMKEAYRAQEESNEQQGSILDMQVGMRISQMDARDALQAMVQDGVAPATAAMDGLAGVTNSVIGLLDAIPGVGREEGRQASNAEFTKGTTVSGPVSSPAAAAATSGYAADYGVSQDQLPTRYDSEAARVTGSLINMLQGGSSITADELFASPNDPAGKTAKRIVRDLSNIGLDTDLSQFVDGDAQDTKVLSALAQQYLGLLKHDEAAAGRQYREEVASAIARELGMDQEEVDSYRKGGISRGPDSGYLSLMHGTEAVVPLPDGKTIPVAFNGLDDMTNAFIDGIQSLSDTMQTTAGGSESPEQTRMLNRNLREQLQSVQEQTKRLDSLIQVTQSNNNIMSKILQNSYA